jgi:putative ABC transport system permease protein
LVQILAESLLLASIGGLLGLAAAALALKASAESLRAFVGDLHMSSGVLAAGLGWIVILGLLTGAIPALAGMRLSIAQALGRK